MESKDLEKLAEEIKASDARTTQELASLRAAIESKGSTDEVARSEAKRLETVLEAQKADYERRLKALDEAILAKQRPGGEDGEEKSIGERFGELVLGDDAWVKDVRSGARRDSRPLGIKSLFAGGRKSNPILTSATTTFVPYQRALGIMPAVQRQLRIRDLFPVFPTTQNAIQYVRETGFAALTTASVSSITRSSNVATVTTSGSHGLAVNDSVDLTGADQSDYVGVFRVRSVPSATTFTVYVANGSATTPATGTILWRKVNTHGAAAAVAEGQAKPEADMKFSEETSNVRTIAHWLPASRQVLDDLPQLRQMVDGRLMYGLEFAEEAQILYGNASGANLQGIMTSPYVQTYAWSAGTSGDTKLDAIRRAMTLAQKADYPVSGVILNPTDWESIELTKDATENYIRGVSVDQAGVLRLWGVPLVVTNAMQAGDALLGAFQQGAAIWDREQANVRFSEHHASFFTSNLLAILAEERMTTTIYRPEAFVAVDFDAAP